MLLSHTSRYTEPTTEQFAALGRAVVEWANVERLLSMLLSRLLATPEFLARTYTDSMSAVRMQEAISQAVEIHRIRYSNRLISEQHLREIQGINGGVSALRTFAGFADSGVTTPGSGLNGTYSPGK